MATAANSSAINHSPRLSGDNPNSPQSRRAPAAAARTASPPWTQIVRGGDSEAIIAAPSSPSSVSTAVVQEQVIGSSSDCSPAKPSSPDDSATESSSDNGNGNAAKKPAWNKPSNGAVEVGPVMDAVSWPALSESARASQKSPSDSLKASSEGSVPVSQGTGSAPSSQRQVTNNANPNSTPNHTVPTRQKSMRRGGVNTPANGAFPQSPAPPGPVVEMPSNISSNTHKSSNWETGQRGGSGSQSHSGNDHPQQRNSFRRGNGGPHPRGDGSYNHNYGGRREDRANHGWNHQRSFNNRDTHMQPQRVIPRGFIQHGSAPFMSHPPIRPFGTPVGFPEISPIYYVPAPPGESIRGLPFVSPLTHSAMFFAVPDPQLFPKLVSQIEYYFSNENLIKDTYLRQNMDDQGWVPVKLIAGFNKVTLLTDNIQLILDAVRTSNIVEVQGDKVRKRNDWMRWVMPPSVQFPTNSGTQSLGRSGHDMLAARVQNVFLEEKTNNHTSARGQADVHAEAFLSRSSSGDLSSQSQPSSGEGTGQVAVQAGSDRSVLARNSSKRDSS